jgi:hypothetical protein
MLPWATVTFDSEVADVGLRPGEVICQLGTDEMIELGREESPK